MSSRNKFKQDRKRLAAMRAAGVVWNPRYAIPTFPAKMTAKQEEVASKLYDKLSEEFINRHFGRNRD